jgi:putative phosphonate metabolism protein
MSPSPMSDAPRYAIYAAPPAASALAAFGKAWLGRNAETADDAPPLALDGLSHDRWREITKDARHYAFHGTLKAPFALADGMTADALMAAVAALAARCRPFGAPLMLARIAGFLALVPAQDLPPLHRLADACVEAFDGFRRPESAEQIERRRTGLTARQSALLDRWGYPYVFEEFRFHMTLTARLGDNEAARLQDALAPHVAPLLCEPLPVADLCLFAQDNRQAPFRLIRRFPFGETVSA